MTNIPCPYCKLLGPHKTEEINEKLVLASCYLCKKEWKIYPKAKKPNSIQYRLGNGFADKDEADDFADDEYYLRAGA